MSDVKSPALTSSSLSSCTYGLLTVIALLVGPFTRIGIQYLMLKVTSGLCQTLDSKEVASLIHDFSSVMGILLAMTGAVSVIFLISIICFMKGVA